MTGSDGVFKALADPTRRQILSLLRKREQTAGALAERFDMSKPSMSHHFAVLQQADLITRRREGQQIWYALNTTVFEDVTAWMLGLQEARAGKKKKKEKKRHDTQTAVA